MVSDNTKIEWTEATWNPVTGCTKVSPGCDHCYAETFAERFRGKAGHHFENGFDVTLRPERLDQPLKWKRPRRIFVNSMSDLFHDDVPDSLIAEVFSVMARAPRHTFQLLTKRHGRMRSLLSRPSFRDNLAMWGQPWPLPNVWLGVSVEDQKWANIRIPALLDTPAAVRWISAEPLLGPVDLRSIPYRGDTNYLLDVLHGRYRTSGPPSDSIGTTPFSFGLAGLGQVDWVVVGGESGPGARPMLPLWATSLRRQCERAGVAFLFKQWGSWAPSRNGNLVSVLDTEGHEYQARMYRAAKSFTGRVLDGQTWDQYPAVTS